AIVLGLILAMQMLGGDPEAAYITGGLAALYAILLDVQFGIGLGVALDLVFLAKQIVRPIWNEAGKTVADYSLLLTAPVLAIGGPATLWRMRLKPRHAETNRDEARRQMRRLECLALAALVAVGVSAVQWIPAWEFSRISLRAVGGIHHEPYAF